MATPRGRRGTSSLGPAAGPVQGPLSSRQRPAPAARSAGGQRKGAALCDPFLHISCSACDSWGSRNKGGRQFKDLQFREAKGLGTEAQSKAQSGQETA